MRRAGKVDRNHTEIVDALRARGAFVFSLAPMGSGCPDLLVGFNGRWILVEVKDGLKSTSQQKLTTDQVKWQMEAHKQFCAVWTVNSVQQALGVLSAY